MNGWEKSNLDISVNNTIDNHNNWSSIGNVGQNDDFGDGGYSVVGINVNQIPNMRTAIREYVDKITNHMDNINPILSSSSAFQSDEVKIATEKFINTVKEIVSNYLSGLLVFSDKLEDISEVYQRNVERLAKTIDDATNNTDIGTKYTEQK